MYYQHIKSVLNQSECEELIHFGETNGFVQATVDYYGEKKNISSIRNNERIEWDDTLLNLHLEKKLKLALNSQFPYRFDSFLYQKTGSHFRMYKYTPEQYFKPHKDGHYIDGTLESHITVLFYLNDTQGGETILMPNGFKHPEDFVHIEPKQGDVLLFEHGLWHEGRPVTSGAKYVMRTDLFYSFD